MNARSLREGGFTLVEMLVVLAIVAALTIAAVASLNGRPNAAVRTTVDDLEGVLSGAQKLAVASGLDVYLVADGTWDPKASSPFILAYDTIKQVDRDTKPSDPASAARERIVARARDPHGDITDPPGVYRILFNPLTNVQNREQSYAGVVVGDSDWYTTALGTTPDLASIAPGNLSPLDSALASTARLCKGTTNFVTVSGVSKRFTSPFHIQVVGIRNAQALPGSPIGVLIVPNNSGTVYKFMNTGKFNESKWRRM